MKLVWTRKAKLRLEAILNHIESEFGRTTRDQFRTRTKEFTSLLAKCPEIGEVEVKETKNKGISNHETDQGFLSIDRYSHYNLNAF